MPTPHRSASFATIAQNLVSRLETVLNRASGDGYVRLVVAPNPDWSPYRAENGVHVVVYPPSPNPAAGRYDTKVQRDVVIHVISESLSDVGGRDDIATLAHIVLEEKVIDAVKDLYPASPHTGTAVMVRWKGGAAQQQRLMTKDAGLVVSSLAFEVTYAFPFTVTSTES